MTTQENQIDKLVKYTKFGAEVTLNFPIRVKGEEVSKLTLRRPNVGDLKIIDNTSSNKMDEDIKLFSRLCTPRLSHLEIEELDALDFQILGVVLQSFFKMPQATIKS